MSPRRGGRVRRSGSLPLEAGTTRQLRLQQNPAPCKLPEPVQRVQRKVGLQANEPVGAAKNRLGQEMKYECRAGSGRNDRFRSLTNGRKKKPKLSPWKHYLQKWRQLQHFFSGCNGNGVAAVRP